MWGWDLRIAILVGLILGSTLTFPAMMLTYFAGSIIWIWFIIYQRIKQKSRDNSWIISTNTEIPFWPFLAIWFFLAVFFQEEIIKFMEIYLNI